MLVRSRAKANAIRPLIPELPLKEGSPCQPRPGTPWQRAPRAKVHTRLTTQILVVGSGAIGSIFARLLVEAGLHVTMVDAGPIVSDPPGDHLRNAGLAGRSADEFGEIARSLLTPISVAQALAREPRAHESPAQVRRGNLEAPATLYAVGGMLTLWSCVIPRPRGTQLIHELPGDELAKLYSAAESLLGYDPRLTGGTPVDRVLAEHLTAHGYEVEPLPLAVRIDPDTCTLRYTGAAQVLGAARESLELLPQHVCRELRWRREGDRATVEGGVLVDLRRGAELTVAADAVVVACGAILTPQLLFASGIWRDRLPALGRYLTDHPKLFGFVRMSPRLLRRIAARARDSEGPAVCAPAPALTIPADADRGRPWHTQITSDHLPAGFASPGVDHHELAQLRWFAPCQPSRDNEVGYARNRRDAMGMPRPMFDFRLSAEDRRVVAAMRDDCYEVARLLGGFLPGFEGRAEPLGNSVHAAGTSRIGTDPQTSACDLDSRVWGFENLYLGGNGVIPNAHSVNPTLTAAALAVRSARALSSRLRGR
jgi:pyranose oxidase